MDRSTYNQAMDVLEKLDKSVESAITQLQDLKDQEKPEGWDGKEKQV